VDELCVYPDRQALGAAVAAAIVERAQRVIKARGWFHFVLAGGSTPQPAYRLLSESTHRAQIDWLRVHVYWGDERCVPPHHSESNYRMAYETLLAHVPIPDSQIHRIEGELPPHAAAAYQVTLLDLLGPKPRFDLVLLGMGADGHTASLFPDSPALDVQDDLAVAVYAPEQATQWRVTLTLPVLNATRAVLFLASGREKAKALMRVRNGEPLPAGLVQPRSGEAKWFADRQAGERLPQ
jgi:6-phosphogluconolactonase